MTHPPINGQQCIHMSYVKDGMVQCPLAADQSNSVTHGWLCEKHYHHVRTKPNCGKELEK